MYFIPNKERLRKLNLDNIKIGQTILFCPGCDWQAVNIGMKPQCPECGKSLHVTKVDKELIDLK